jgi:hypothetical protein
MRGDMADTHPEILKEAEGLAADKGYDDSEIIEKLWDGHRMAPIIPKRKIGRTASRRVPCRMGPTTSLTIARGSSTKAPRGTGGSARSSIGAVNGSVTGGPSPRWHARA